MASRHVTADDLGADRRRALDLTPVSRETLARLESFVALLLHWQPRTNLIAASTVRQLWTRHIADSLQLLDLVPEARVWVDVGSGAGFPGLPIACALADKSRGEVHLIESNAKKAAFLREAVRVTGAPAQVHATRLESVAGTLPAGIEVVSARAVAHLNQLFTMCFPLLAKNGVTGLFPKGHNAGRELEEAAGRWTVRAELVHSRTDHRSQIVVIRKLERLPTPNRVATDS
jgi:16S rRNA (guanine527-N7)-methyltransferase